MKKPISFALVLALSLVVNVTRADFTFGTSIPLMDAYTLGNEFGSSISADGLSLYFTTGPKWPGGYGHFDIWVTTRKDVNDPFEAPQNLGPAVNSPASECEPSISRDGLSLYLCDGLWDGGIARPGGFGKGDLWVTTRPAVDSDWCIPENLGPVVNSAATEAGPSISGDGLSLFFESDRPAGSGVHDVWVTTRSTLSDKWSEPVNLGPAVNSSSEDGQADISANGLALFFQSGRFGRHDTLVTIRAARGEPFGPPVLIGPLIDSSVYAITPNVSADGRTLFFTDWRSVTDYNIAQAPIIPILDLNGDGIVDSADMCIIVDHWGTDNKLCDIGPMPWGDGIVDVQDLIVLAEHLFEEVPPVESVEVNEDNDGGQVELELGRILIVTLESNPSTGYRWEQAEDNASILEQLGEAEFKSSSTSDPPLVGAGGWEIFRFKTMSAGQMTLKLVYHRPWEDVEPLRTFTIQTIVH
ncbi:protease inhibitor I42 family protein [Planctomycetota bacterium]